MKKPVRAAIIGSRGIPNNYGGFEQLAEYLALGLTEAGYEVTVYNPHFHPLKTSNWHGVRRILCFDPEPVIGPAGHFIYDLLCILDSRRRHFDVILQLGYTTNAVWNWLLHKKTVIITNMDGMEWKRSKYSPPVKIFLRFSERWAVNNSHFLVSDSLVIRDYYLEKYGRDSSFIAYGVNEPIRVDPAGLSKYNLGIQSYILIIARFQKDNNIEMSIQGFLNSKTNRTLIIVGNSGNRYGNYLKKKYTSDRIRFAGPVYNKAELDLFRFFCYFYIHGHSCGGTNPSLLEAMACGSKIMAHDNPFNRSVLKENGTYFNSAEEIREILDKYDGVQPQELSEKAILNQAAVFKNYSWEKIISQYKDLIDKSLIKLS